MKNTLPLMGFALCVFTLTACAKDELMQVCVSKENTFDIEEVSSLEDAWGWLGLRDAINLSYDTSELSAIGTWRVSSVDVLVLVPESEFNNLPSTLELVVEVYDSTDPGQSAPWKVRQSLSPNDLTWERVVLSQEPSGAVSDDPFASFEPKERAQYKAWWNFDFASTIPETGMSSTDFSVAVHWLSSSYPTLGYSQFNRPCSGNWTNYDGAYPSHGLTGDGWGNNGVRFGSDVCNWPMLKVNVERRDEGTNCGGPR